MKFDEVRYLLGGSGRPSDADDTEKFVEISQKPWNQANMFDMMIFALFFIGALVVVYVAFNINTGGGGDGGSSVNIAISLVPGVIG